MLVTHQTPRQLPGKVEVRKPTKTRIAHTRPILAILSRMIVAEEADDLFVNVEHHKLTKTT